MKKHILIIEDDIAIAEMLVMLLKTRGYSAQYVDNAHLAIAILSSADTATQSEETDDISCTTAHAAFPDVILLDFVLPDMNGKDLLQSLADVLPMLPPVIIMSALPAHMLEGVEHISKTVQFLPKPFPIPALIERLEMTLAN